MKITLVVLFLAGLTIYCKCAAVLSAPPSLIAHAASLDDSLKIQKPFTGQNIESQQQLLAKADEEGSNEPVLAADLYNNFKNLWHNDLSSNSQKREQRNTFDDAIDDVAEVQQAIATIKKNNQNQNALQPHDNDNVGHKNYNHNNNNNKNENNILKSSTTSSLPLSRSSAATDMNEATNSNLNMQPKVQFPSQNIAKTEPYENSNELFNFSPEMIDDYFVAPPHQIQEPLQLKRRVLENMPSAATAVATEDTPFLNRFLKSTKYWSRQCPLENENNCLQEYYGALIADRNNALLKQNNPFAETEKSSSPLSHNNDINDDDIVLLLTAEQNLMQFLSWALSVLYPYGKFSNKMDNGADYYHPGMYMWKKFNLSGRVEPPLLVDEPHYVIARREYDQNDDDNDLKRGSNYGEDPFIPPRGRKHNLPDLDSLLQRYETFVPNRGRRDKIRDIFKYDDLFYPNRGKRQMTTATNDNGDILDERSDDTGIGIDDIKGNQHYYNNEQNAERHEMQHLLLSNELMEYIENLIAKMKRKLHQQLKQQQDEKLANIFDQIFHRNEPGIKMSTTFQQAPPSAPASPSLLKKRLKSMINILYSNKKPQLQHLPNHYNSRHQWWKNYAAAKASSPQPADSNDRPMPAIRSPTMATNRLQTTLKSMSPLQQLTQLYRQRQQIPDLSPPHLKPDNKFMWQQQKSLAQHFDPLLWHKLQLLLKQQQLQQQYHHIHHQPLLALRHPRLTALQHLPAIQHEQQQQQQQQQQMATPQETQLKYSYDQLDNSITNDLDNSYNKDLD